MGNNTLKNSKRIFTTPNGDPSIPSRVTNLENNEYKITYYEIVSGTSGSLTIPTGATINADEFGLSGNSILSKIDGFNKPTFESPKTSSGTIVTANLNTTTSAWVSSGIYTDSSVALIYSIRIKAFYVSNLSYNKIIETIDVGIAHLDSPTFTGVPIAPTATLGTNTTQLATTAFVLANGAAPTINATQIAFGSAGNAITSNTNLVVNTTTGNLSAPLVINVGGVPTGGYDIFNHFQMPEMITAFKSTTAGKPSEIQVYNNLNVLQFGVEGASNGTRMNGTLNYNLYFGCYANYGITFHTNNAVRGYVSAGGNWFFGGNTIGTAIVHIKAGTATAGTAPLKLTTGVNLTALENGAVEYDGTNLTLTALGTRQTVHKGLNGSFSGTGTATTTFVVTFGGTQPNATYQVNITPTNAITAAVLYVTSKTTTTFTVTFLTGLTGTVAFDWVLTQ